MVNHFAISLGMVATGVHHTDRAPGQVVLLDLQDEDSQISEFILVPAAKKGGGGSSPTSAASPTGGAGDQQTRGESPVVSSAAGDFGDEAAGGETVAGSDNGSIFSALQPITSINIFDCIDNGIALTMAVEKLRLYLHPQVFLYGLHIKTVCSVLGLQQGKDYGGVIDVNDFFAYKDPVFGSRSYFALRHILACTERTPTALALAAGDQAPSGGGVHQLASGGGGGMMMMSGRNSNNNTIKPPPTIPATGAATTFRGIESIREGPELEIEMIAQLWKKFKFKEGAKVKELRETCMKTEPDVTILEHLNFKFEGVCLSSLRSRCTCTADSTEPSTIRKISSKEADTLMKKKATDKRETLKRTVASLSANPALMTTTEGATAAAAVNPVAAGSSVQVGGVGSSSATNPQQQQQRKAALDTATMMALAAQRERYMQQAQMFMANGGGGGGVGVGVSSGALGGGMIDYNSSSSGWTSSTPISVTPNGALQPDQAQTTTTKKTAARSSSRSQRDPQKSRPNVHPGGWLVPGAVPAGAGPNNFAPVSVSVGVGGMHPGATRGGKGRASSPSFKPMGDHQPSRTGTSPVPHHQQTPAEGALPSRPHKRGNYSSAKAAAKRAQLNNSGGLTQQHQQEEINEGGDGPLPHSQFNTESRAGPQKYLQQHQDPVAASPYGSHTSASSVVGLNVGERQQQHQTYHEDDDMLDLHMKALLSDLGTEIGGTSGIQSSANGVKVGGAGPTTLPPSSTASTTSSMWGPTVTTTLSSTPAAATSSSPASSSKLPLNLQPYAGAGNKSSWTVPPSSGSTLKPTKRASASAQRAHPGPHADIGGADDEPHAASTSQQEESEAGPSVRRGAPGWRTQS